jgi:hypothetical protein
MEQVTWLQKLSLTFGLENIDMTVFLLNLSDHGTRGMGQRSERIDRYTRLRLFDRPRSHSSRRQWIHKECTHPAKRPGHGDALGGSVARANRQGRKGSVL